MMFERQKHEGNVITEGLRFLQWFPKLQGSALISLTPTLTSSVIWY